MLIFQGSCRFTVGGWHFTENRKPKTGNHLGLPATSWPGPQALQGTPAAPRPGLGPLGCGWVLLSIQPGALEIIPHLWQA